jgi:gliding motility-associated-like protein
LFLQNGDIPLPNTSVVIDVFDNCSQNPTVALFSENTVGYCPKIIDRIYSITDNCGNVSFVTHTIVIQEYINQVNANFSFNPQSIDAINSTIQFVNSSTNATSYQWFFGDNNGSTQYQPNYEYEYDPENCVGFTVTLIASDGNCFDTIRQVIQCKEETIFYVPNTFTPDGDNFNQTFFPVFYSGFDPFNFEMLIFNRWGELIFESHNANIGWDGSYGNPNRDCQDGIYTWKITYKDKYIDERKIVIGHVTLIR